MNEERLIELLVELHRDLPRQGPGCTASTLRALSLCKDLPEHPNVLDVGCGAGVQTVDLARATRGSITAVDLFQPFLDQLGRSADDAGLTDRIDIRQADMNALPFAEGSFDLIWSEGAIYIMGFDNGLEKWRPLVRPGGWLAVTEITWLTDDVPQECYSHWMSECPFMRSVADNITAADTLGWRDAGHFVLPTTAWTEDYYSHLKARLPQFEANNPGDEDAKAVAQMTYTEMDLFDRYSDHYNYVFYVFQRTD